MTDPWTWLWTATVLTGLVFGVVRLAEATFGRRVPAVVRVASYALVFFRLLTPATSTHGGAVLPDQVMVVSVAAAEFAPELQAADDAAVAQTDAPLPWLQILYGGGVLLVFGVGLASWRRERSVLRASTRQSGIDGAPVWVHETEGPCVLGTFRPRVVLPLEFGTLPASVQACVLAHERAHVRGRDPWIVAALRVGLALAWPVLPCWWAASRIRSLLEVRADAAAIAALAVGPAEYGRALIGMASARPWGRLPALSGYRSLSERIAAVAAGRPRAHRSGALLLGLGLAAAACSVPAETLPAPEALAAAPAPESPRSSGDGRLVQVQDSEVLRVARPALAWATPEAARELAAIAQRLRAVRPGTVLTVGDVSRRGGGRFPPHRTHRDGREVDLPWPVDEEGRLLSEQAWELLQALSENGNVAELVIDGEIHEGVREAALASGATAEAVAGLLPDPGEQATHPSRHVHVRFRAGGAS